MPLPDTSVPIDCPKSGEIYYHYKGHYCAVLGTGRHTETGELLVAYVEHSTGLFFLRPWHSWLDYIPSMGCYRFTLTSLPGNSNASKN